MTIPAGLRCPDTHLIPRIAQLISRRPEGNAQFDPCALAFNRCSAFRALPPADDPNITPLSPRPLACFSLIIRWEWAEKSIL